MHHLTRSRSEAPQTAGKIIRWARWYDLVTWLISFGRAPAIRRNSLDLAAIRDGESALDVGCGTGTLTLGAKRRAGDGQVHGLDASPEMIEVAREKAAKQGMDVDFQVALIEDLPFPDGTFDVVLSSLMLHHLPDNLKRKGFLEIYRVLKPGGRLFAVDISGGKGIASTVMGLAGHRLEKDYIHQLTALAREAGFADVESGPVDSGLAYVRAYAWKG